MNDFLLPEMIASSSDPAQFAVQNRIEKRLKRKISNKVENEEITNLYYRK